MPISAVLRDYSLAAVVSGGKSFSAEAAGEGGGGSVKGKKN